MADITITAASVLPGTNASLKYGTSGGTLVAGKAVYKDAADKLWKLADSDASGAETAQGIALTGSSTGQPVVVLTGGDITIGATLTAGAGYYLSNTAGGICPVADVGSGENVCLIGMAKTTGILAVNIQTPGVTL